MAKRDRPTRGVPNPVHHGYESTYTGQAWSQDPRLQGQGMLVNPTQFEPVHTHLPRWEDVPDTNKGKQISKARTEEGLSAEGLSIGGMADNIESLVRANFDRDVEGAKQAMRFYSHDYPSQAAELSREGGITQEQAVDAIAATSPQTRWDQNTAVAAAAVGTVAAGRAGLSPERVAEVRAQRPTGLESNVTKAVDMLESGQTLFDVTEGKKTQSFAQTGRTPNNPRNRTTMDVHAVAAAIGDEHPVYSAAVMPTGKEQQVENKRAGNARAQWLGRGANYEAADEAHAIVGERLGMHREEVQAVAWHQRKFENEQRPGHAGAMARQASLEEKRPSRNYLPPGESKMKPMDTLLGPSGEPRKAAGLTPDSARPPGWYPGKRIR